MKKLWGYRDTLYLNYGGGYGLSRLSKFTPVQLKSVNFTGYK